MDFSQSESQELFNHLIVLILNDQYIRFMYIMLALWIQCIYFSPTMLMNTPQINTHWFVVDRDRQQMYWFRLIIYKS